MDLHIVMVLIHRTFPILYMDVFTEWTDHWERERERTKVLKHCQYSVYPKWPHGNDTDLLVAVRK